MFICRTCIEQYEGPAINTAKQLTEISQGRFLSHGKCEICEKPGQECFDIPSSGSWMPKVLKATFDDTERAPGDTINWHNVAMSMYEAWREVTDRQLAATPNRKYPQWEILPQPLKDAWIAAARKAFELAHAIVTT